MSSLAFAVKDGLERESADRMAIMHTGQTALLCYIRVREREKRDFTCELLP